MSDIRSLPGRGDKTRPIPGIIAVAAALAVSFGAASARAEEGAETLAKEKGCLICHNVDTEGTAPSFRDISRRFSGLSNAKEMLVPLVHSGTDRPVAYHWGANKMPPEGARRPVSKEEAEALIDYILSVK